MNAKKQLESLYRIQGLALAIRSASEIIDTRDARLEEIEARFRERNTEYVAVKDHYDEIEADQKARSSQLKVLEEQREKYQSSLMTVKNQREYAAMLKEIDTVKAEISENEDTVLKNMEALEKLKSDLAEHEDHIAREREEVAKQTTAVNAEAADAERRLADLQAKRDKIESRLPERVRATIARLEATRQGIFLSKADNGVCQSCYVRIRPQVFQEIKSAGAVHSCDNCRRFLFYEPSIVDAPATAAGGSSDGNGGADAKASAQASAPVEDVRPATDAQPANEHSI